MRLFFLVQKFTHSIGASEDLVTAAALRLAKSGTAPGFWFNFEPPASDARIKSLREAGCALHFPRRKTLLGRIANRVGLRKIADARLAELASCLKEAAPDLVVVNQGGNSDAWAEMEMLRRLGLPYVVKCNSATEFSWPNAAFAATLRDGFLGAAQVCFVSRENRELTESQIGSRIPNCSIVRYPCKIAAPVPADWPGEQAGYRLACVARLDTRMKGQDLIMQALSRPHWQDRQLSISFFGEGDDRPQLESLAHSLGLQSKVVFHGHVSDIAGIWNSHHGFIQPSRYEGFGLSLLEACFFGRIAVVTPFPAAREFVRDGVSGFVAANASPDAVDDAMCRAWDARAHWREMGGSAIDLARTYPADPTPDFLRLLASAIR